MPPLTREQLRREAADWAGLSKEMLERVLEALQAAGRSEPQEEGGLSFCETSAVVRLVCPGWQAVYDAMVRRLALRQETTDEAVGMLVRRFPAVTSVQFKSYGGITCAVTDVGVLAVCNLPALTLLDLSFCRNITDVGVLAVCGLPALTALKLDNCHKITNEGVLTLSSLPALAHLNLRLCFKVTAAGVQALRSTTASPNLVIEFG